MQLILVWFVPKYMFFGMVNPTDWSKISLYWFFLKSVSAVIVTMIVMYSHLITANWELTLWYRKQLWRTFQFAIHVLFCKKFFLERFLLMGQLSRELSFGALLTPGKVKTHLQTCNDILNYNAMQCKSHLLFLSHPKYAAYLWNNKGAAFYSAACPDPAAASPNKRLAQYRGWSAACHLSKSSSSVPSL